MNFNLSPAARQREVKGRALIPAALRPHPAAELGDEASYYGQADARSLEIFAALETLENAE